MTRMSAVISGQFLVFSQGAKNRGKRACLRVYQGPTASKLGLKVRVGPRRIPVWGKRTESKLGAGGDATNPLTTWIMRRQRLPNGPSHLTATQVQCIAVMAALHQDA